MILQALNSYYDRLVKEPDIDIPQFGFSSEKVSYSIVLKENGEYSFRSLMIPNAKGKMVPRPMLVPKLKGRSGKNPPPYFLWDNTKYILGADDKGEYPDRFEAFKQAIKQAAEAVDDSGLSAASGFLEKWEPTKAVNLENWSEIAGSNLVFELFADEGKFVHERSAVVDYWQKKALQDQSNAQQGFCLISGKKSPIAPTHFPIKGVVGAQSSGAAIVSFNLQSFTSFGKKQNLNAPVSEQSAFAYTTALNYLLSSNSGQKVRIADSTVVFWTEKESDMEDIFAEFIEARDDGSSQELHDFLKKAGQGAYASEPDEDNLFYILGLAPNAARLSVRFWHVSTVEEIGCRLKEHFANLAIIRSHEKDAEYPGLWRLMLETAPQRKPENMSPILVGNVLRSILAGSQYPGSLLSMILCRIRADHAINYLRAAMIKAILLKNTNREVTMSLNPKDKNPAYMLGRLFAVLESNQNRALGNINATIKDRYFGAASATPKSVFPILLRNGQNHLKKMDVGARVNREKLMGTIMEGIQKFPTHLTMEEQGMFMIGYYHQRQDLFKSRTETKED